MKSSTGHDSEAGGSGKPLIFVVDDEAMLLELARIILEPAGYAVQTFGDPASAFEAFVAAAPPPALLITDYAMHEMNGMALIAACRKIRPSQKIILISGTVGEEIFAKAPVTPDRFLAKPYDARQLVEAVNSILKD
jgi:DNA-binding NtrC family response regulator